MSDFADYFSNADYAHVYAKSEDCVALVYIESEQDRAFWQPILAQHSTRKYKFQCGTQTNPGARSKTLFKDLFAKANPNALVAVDSDFDYLASARSEVAQAINANPYVLQTFAYSVESLDLEINTLDHCLRATHFYLEHSFKLSDFLQQYSGEIYPLLLRYLYLMDQQVAGLPDEKAFHQVLTVFNFDRLCFDPDGDHRWAAFAAQLAPLQAQLDEMADAAGLAEFERLVRGKGMNEVNSYQFINGHRLEEQIVKPLVLAITNRIKAEEMTRITEEFRGSEIEKRKKEMNKHFKDRCAFATLAAVCALKKQDPLYLKICSGLADLSL